MALFYNAFTYFHCQVIADFDATLTKYWVNGHRGQSKCQMFIVLLSSIEVESVVFLQDCPLELLSVFSNNLCSQPWPFATG